MNKVIKNTLINEIRGFLLYNSSDKGRIIMKEEVYQYLLTIPKGKVVTYKQIAEYLGNPKLARVVGNILHTNPDENKYPCYKVVNSKGKLSEHFAFGGIEAQKQKLEDENIKVVNNIVDLKKYQYNSKTYYTYILRCKDNSLYTGITTDLERRLKEHKEKGAKTAKYTLRHEAEKFEIAWKSENRMLSSKLEFNIKKLTKKQKEELIKNPKLLNNFLGDKIESELYKVIKEE